MIGKVVSHYKILSKLGEGGMGVVYKAEDTRLKRTVALKFLPQALTNDIEAKGRFTLEAQAASALDHPNVCTIHDIGETEDGQTFIAMACYEGETLKEKIERGPLPIQDGVDIAEQTAQGLARAHEKGIIHRDVKPANIFVGNDGIVRILDFGLAKLVGSQTQLTRTGTTLGTVAYMSPEQARGEEVDGRTDVWSLGVVMYEMLAGHRPFKGEHEQALLYLINNVDPEPLQRHISGVSLQLGQIVSRALEKKADSRYSTAGQLREDLKRYCDSLRPSGRGGFDLRTLLRALRKPRVAIPAVAGVLAICLGAIWFFDYQSKVHWARDVALPEIEKMIAENDVWRNLIAPYKLAEKAEAILGDDARLAELFSKCALNVNVETDPPGARVYAKEYSEPNGEWLYLGVSPLETIRMPIGIFRWKFEKEGYETVLAAASTWALQRGGGKDIVAGYALLRTLDEKGRLPEGMVRVQTTTTAVGKLGDFYIDRCEITNRAYKAFVDAGGYRKREYWKHPFVKDGRVLAGEVAMRHFLDRSEQPGPSTWLGGDYPQGQGDHPVSGVSWYEAAAYGEYVGKSLPTSAHWNAARGGWTPMISTPQLGGFALLAPFSNFGGSGPVSVGSLPGITAYGAFDMAGNVREWCWNETPQGRLIRGGAWDDNTYEFGNLRQAPPLDRSPKNGFRLAVYPDTNSVPDSAFAIQRLRPSIDYRTQRPAPDAIFEVYRELFSYDETELNARVEYREESPGGWIREKISFDAAYAGERVPTYLFLPTNTRPPYQTVVYFPGSATAWMASSREIEDYYEFPLFLSFLVRNGRAVLIPVYKGTFERGSPALQALHIPSETYAYTELLVQQVKDFMRSLDYLRTRPDINGGKIAYYGMSWGASLGAMIPAIEGRIAASVLVAGGLGRMARPEASKINYVTRVKIPTLMLNGRYDSLHDIREDVEPMFHLLGTRVEHKRLILYDTDHLPPRAEYVKETLAWLDRYLGPL